MAILDQAAQLAKQKLGDDFHVLTIERSVVGLFFTGVKLSNGAGGARKALWDTARLPSSLSVSWKADLASSVLNVALLAVGSSSFAVNSQTQASASAIDFEASSSIVCII